VTRSELRTVLRRQINEVTAQSWTDAELNVYVNIGVQAIAKEIYKIDPMAFRSTELINVVSGTTDYNFATAVQDQLGVMLVERMGPNSTSYVHQTRADLEVVRDYLLNGVLVGLPSITNRIDGVYAISGMGTVVIAPSPTQNVTSGLRITLRPMFTLASDSSEPLFPEPFHIGVIYAAKLAALGETWAETERVEKRLNEVIADLPFYFSRDDGEPQAFRPQGIAGGNWSTVPSLIGIHRY
jgi:hypothetical protein